jgi:hypothetical protein
MVDDGFMEKHAFASAAKTDQKMKRCVLGVRRVVGRAQF